MKKYLFASLLLSSFSTLAQPYSNHLSYIVEWYEFSGGWGGVSGWSDYSTIYIDGDTIINEVDYFKVYRTRMFIQGDAFGGPDDTIFYDPVYSGAIRESLDNKFFWIDYGTSVEIMQNDFELEFGDLLEDNCEVEIIDTLYLGATPLRRFRKPGFNVGNGLVEGIGKTGPYCLVAVESSFFLVCFRKDDDWLTLESEIDCSSFLPPQRQFTQVGEINKPDIDIFPNPANGILNIKFSTLATGQIGVLCLTSGFGQNVIRVVINPTQTEISMNTSKIASGLYQLSLVSGNEMVLRRQLIIAH